MCLVFIWAVPSGRAIRHSATLRPCGQPPAGRLGYYPYRWPCRPGGVGGKHLLHQPPRLTPYPARPPAFRASTKASTRSQTPAPARPAVANPQGRRLPLVGISHAGPRRPSHTARTLRLPAASRAARPTGRAARPPPPAHRPGPALPLHPAHKPTLRFATGPGLFLPHSCCCWGHIISRFPLTPACRTAATQPGPRRHNLPTPGSAAAPPEPAAPVPAAASTPYASSATLRYARSSLRTSAPLSLRLLRSGRSGRSSGGPLLCQPHNKARFAECLLGAAPQTPCHHAPAGAVSSSSGPPAHPTAPPS